MANLSDVHGIIEFDFSRVRKVSKKDIIQFVKTYAKAVSANTDYWTEITIDDGNEIPKVKEKGQTLCVGFNFNAVGRWTYNNNLDWLTESTSEHYKKLRKLLRKYKGLLISIDWKEYETGCMFISTGDYTLEVKSNKLERYYHSEEYDLTKELYTYYEFGDENDWNEMMGMEDDDF